MKTVAAILLCLAAVGFGADSPSALKVSVAIPLRGVSGRFDHCAIDVKGQRLFIAALGNNTVEVLDLPTGKRLGTVSGVRKPQGVAYLPESNHLVVASGGDDMVKFFDAAGFKLLATVQGLPDVDNLRLDASAGIIYAGYGDGALAVIDAATMKQIASIKLAGHPESFQLETNGSRIFVNVPDAKHIAVVDRQSRSVAATWPLTEFRANFPMALDEASHRLFVGCRHPARLLILDTASGQRLADVEISGDTDDLFYDAKRRRLYVSCGEGFVDVIEQQGSEKFRRREQVPTRGGARTSFFSADRDEFYLAVPQRILHEAEVWIYRPEGNSR